MGVLQMDYCQFCGAEVFYEEGQVLTRCRACGQTVRTTEFLSEQRRLEKALEAERIAKQELEKARKEAEAAKEQLNNTLQILGNLRNSNDLQEEQLRQVISSLDISKENQEALRKMLQALGETSQNEHAQITGLIRTVIDHQDTMTDKLQALRSFSNTLLEKSDDTMALISSLSEHLHSDTASLKEAVAELANWNRSTHENDLAFLRDIQNASNALLETQNESLQKISAIEKRQQEALERLEHFESKWKKSRLDEMIGLYHQAENLQVDREYEKAADYYRQVIVKGGKDPEVWWRIVQCHYGVNCQIDNEGSSVITLLCPDLSDPAEMSIRRDLENSLTTDEQKTYYHTELHKIDAILDKYRYYRHQVNYDIFISVKQKDNGHYTDDSDVGSELYNYLSSQGYRVFNSRRSIPAGVEYEPYILAALLSSKVLIVVGSCPEYINSQWVKNEWSRFQWLQKHETEVNGSSDRVLLCYLAKGMDPYSIPKALNPSYQAIIDGLNAERQLNEALTAAFKSQPDPKPSPKPSPKPEPKPVPKPDHKTFRFFGRTKSPTLKTIKQEEPDNKVGKPSEQASSKMPVWIERLSALSMLALIFLTWTVYGSDGRNISRLCVAALNIILAVVLIVVLRIKGQKRYYISKVMALFIMSASVAIIIFAVLELSGAGAFNNYYGRYGLLDWRRYEQISREYHDAIVYQYIQTFVLMICSGVIWIALVFLKGTTKKMEYLEQGKVEIITEARPSGQTIGEAPAWIICLAALMMLIIMTFTWSDIYAARGLVRVCAALMNIILAVEFIGVLRKRKQKRCYISEIRVIYILSASIAIIVFAVLEWTHASLYLHDRFNLDIERITCVLASAIIWIALILLKGTTKTTALQGNPEGG